eukprot:gene5253-biopygen8703
MYIYVHGGRSPFSRPRGPPYCHFPQGPTATPRVRPAAPFTRPRARKGSAHSSTHHRAQGRSALGRTRSGENVVQVEPGGTESIGSDPRAHYLDLPRDGRRHPPRTEPDVRGELGGGDAGVHQGGQPCSHNLIGRHPGTRAVEGCGGDAEQPRRVQSHRARFCHLR